MQIENTIMDGIDKARIAIERIKTFEPPEGYYVAFSGGKDSVVILDLVKRAGVKYDAHHNITGIDPPELYYFIRDNFPEVQRHKPEKTMWRLIREKMMPPTRIVRYCCEHLKERGGSGRIVITGVRWAESQKRSKRRMVESCYKDTSKHYLNPIIDWSNADVWQYINECGLAYCKLYDEGFKRLGCIGCPMAGAAGQKREFRRWPKYEKLYRKAFAAAAAANIKSLGAEYSDKRKDGRVLRWETGDDMYDWWLKDHHKKQDPDQSVMFE